MHFFQKKSLRPLPAGIPVEGTNYSDLRASILKTNPLIDEQIDHIKNRTDNDFAPLVARQEKIHTQLRRYIAPEAIGASEPWLMELNDQRCAMEMKGIILTRLLKEQHDKCVDENGSTDKFKWEFWEGYLDNYEILKYLFNRVLKELADYEHGKWYWIENKFPILEPPFQPKEASSAADENEKSDEKGPTFERLLQGWSLGDDDDDDDKDEADKESKHVKFARRVQGWYFNDDDAPILTGAGIDDKVRKNSEFHDRVVDGKSTFKTLIDQSYFKKPGYQRCTDGFKVPAMQRVPSEHRLSEFRKLYRFSEAQLRMECRPRKSERW